MQSTVVRDMDSLQKQLLALAKQNKRVALVPTMGALHAGHMALVAEAQKHADAVIVSIFVNPMQFGQNEDFDKYPRMLEADVKKIDEAGGALVYAPSAEDIYPPGFITTVSVGELGNILCGASRPGHFDGVATVVTKLLVRMLPHVAVFGEKDYQQLCVIRRLAYDLDIPVEIVGLPTVREADGLAMSSRNAYLSPEERKLAPKLHFSLVQTAGRIVHGNTPVSEALKDGIALLTTLGFKVDYLELREAGTLRAMDTFDAPARLLCAGWLGKTRLIDNISME